MGWSTLRESAAWEEYLREVETYAEEDLKEVALGWLDKREAAAARRAAAVVAAARPEKVAKLGTRVGRKMGGRVGALVGSALGHAVGTLVKPEREALPLVLCDKISGVASAGLPLRAPLQDVACLAADECLVSVPPRRGAQLIADLDMTAKWAVLPVLERTLSAEGAEADHSTVTFQALVCAERALRTLTYSGSANIAEGVVRHAADRANYLATIVGESRPMTWTSLAIWIRAMENAVRADEAAVNAWLGERIGAAGILPERRVAEQWFALRNLRNDLAHGEGESVDRPAHQQAMVTLLGSTLDAWWNRAPEPRTPFSALLDAHSARRASVQRDTL